MSRTEFNKEDVTKPRTELLNLRMERLTDGTITETTEKQRVRGVIYDEES